MKHKNNLMFGGILIVVFVLGFITNTILNKDKNNPSFVSETELLISSYSNSIDAVDSIEILSICYYDTANVEMLHYALNYNRGDINDLPNYYVTNFGDTIEFNKENFFRYVALYTVADNLLESRKHIIYGLLANSIIDKEEGIRYKVKE